MWLPLKHDPDEAPHRPQDAMSFNIIDQSRLPRWVVPVIILGILAFLIPQFFKPTRTANPAGSPIATETDVPGKLSNGFTTVLNNVMETLTGIHDTSSANAALPKLREAGAQLETLKGLWAQMPDAAKPAIRTMLSSAVSKLEESFGKVTAIPGVGEIVQPISTEIMTKLKSFLT
jgi:hypothetical protein